MKLMKYFALVAFALFMTSVFADAANVLVSFSTTADKYADGNPVADGEWYALCWSADGVFEGLNLDLSPIDANDLVIMKASLANGGRCPYTIFQIDSQSPKCKRTGIYSVVMLDTRDVNGSPSKTLPTAVNAAAVSKEYKAGSAMSGTSENTSEVAGVWSESKVVIPEGQKPATIKGFKVIDDAKVEIEIENMLPGVKYNVKMGGAIDAIETYGLDVPADANTKDAKVIIDAKDAKFFQLVREPLAK